jgi:FK506-binding nuclear protein
MHIRDINSLMFHGFSSPKLNSAVVIEEIQEDDKPVVGEAQKGSNKKNICEKGDKSQLQLAVRTPPADSIESEDEDGFPVSFGESKRGSESVSKNANETSNEYRKRKSEAMSNHRDSSGYMLFQYSVPKYCLVYGMITC